MSIKWQEQDFYIGKHLPVSLTFNDIIYDIPLKFSYNLSQNRFELNEYESDQLLKWLQGIPK